MLLRREGEVHLIATHFERFLLLKMWIQKIPTSDNLARASLPSHIDWGGNKVNQPVQTEYKFMLYFTLLETGGKHTGETYYLNIAFLTRPINGNIYFKSMLINIEQLFYE